MSKKKIELAGHCKSPSQMLPRHTPIVVPYGNASSTDDVSGGCRSPSVTSLPDDDDDSYNTSGHSFHTSNQSSVEIKADEELSSLKYSTDAGNAGSSPESGDSDTDIQDNSLSSLTSDSEDVPQYILTNVLGRRHTLVPVRDPESVASLLLEWENLPSVVIPPIVLPLADAGVVATQPPYATDMTKQSAVEEPSSTQYAYERLKKRLAFLSGLEVHKLQLQFNQLKISGQNHKRSLRAFENLSSVRKDMSKEGSITYTRRPKSVFSMETKSCSQRPKSNVIGLSAVSTVMDNVQGSANAANNFLQIIGSQEQIRPMQGNRWQEPRMKLPEKVAAKDNHDSGSVLQGLNGHLSQYNHLGKLEAAAKEDTALAKTGSFLISRPSLLMSGLSIDAQNKDDINAQNKDDRSLLPAASATDSYDDGFRTSTTAPAVKSNIKTSSEAACKHLDKKKKRLISFYNRYDPGIAHFRPETVVSLVADRHTATLDSMLSSDTSHNINSNLSLRYKNGNISKVADNREKMGLKGSADHSSNCSSSKHIPKQGHCGNHSCNAPNRSPKPHPKNEENYDDCLGHNINISSKSDDWAMAANAADIQVRCNQCSFGQLISGQTEDWGTPQFSRDLSRSISVLSSVQERRDYVATSVVQATDQKDKNRGSSDGCMGCSDLQDVRCPGLKNRAISANVRLRCRQYCCSRPLLGCVDDEPKGRGVKVFSAGQRLKPSPKNLKLKEKKCFQTVLAGRKLEDPTKDCTALSANAQDMSSALRCCPTDASTDGSTAQAISSCPSEKNTLCLQSARWQAYTEAMFLRGGRPKRNCPTFPQPAKAQKVRLKEKTERDVTFDDILRKLHAINKTSMTELKQKPMSSVDLAETTKEVKLIKYPTKNFFITQHKHEKAEETKMKIEKKFKLVNKLATKQHTDNFNSKIKPTSQLETNCFSVPNNTYFSSLPTPFIHQCKADIYRNTPKVKLTLSKVYEPKPRQLSPRRCMTQNCETQLHSQKTCLGDGKVTTKAICMDTEESHSFVTVSEPLQPPPSLEYTSSLECIGSLECTSSLECTASETELLPWSESITAADSLSETSTGTDLDKLCQNISSISDRVTALSSTKTSCSDSRSKILDKIYKSAPGGWLTAQPTEFPSKNFFNSPETFKQHEHFLGMCRPSRLAKTQPCHFIVQGLKKDFVQKVTSKSEVEKTNDQESSNMIVDLVQKPASNSEAKKLQNKKNSNIMFDNMQKGAQENEMQNAVQQEYMIDMLTDFENGKRARRLSVLHQIAAAVEKDKFNFENTLNKNVENVKPYKLKNKFPLEVKEASEKTNKSVSFKDDADKKIAGQSRCENIKVQDHKLQEGKEKFSAPGRVDTNHNVSEWQKGPSLPIPSALLGSESNQNGVDHYKTVQLAVENLQSRLPNGAHLRKAHRLAESAEHRLRKANSIFTIRSPCHGSSSSYLFETNARRSNKEWQDTKSEGDAEIDSCYPEHTYVPTPERTATEKKGSEYRQICTESLEGDVNLGNPEATTAGSPCIAADGTELAANNMATSTRTVGTDVPSKCSMAHPKPSRRHKSNAEVSDQNQNTFKHIAVRTSPNDDTKSKSSTMKLSPRTERGATKFDEENGSPIEVGISLNNCGQTKMTSWGFALKPLKRNQTSKEDFKAIGSTFSNSEDYQTLASPERQEQRICQSRGNRHPRTKTISKRQMQDIYRTMTDFEKRPQIVSSLRKAIFEISKSNYDRFSRAKTDYHS